MADVLISPGVPKPWLAHQKEPSVLRPGFISAGSAAAAQANLERSFPFSDYLSRSWESSLDSPMPTKFRRLHRQGLPSRESTRCSPRGNSASMSQTPSMGHCHPVAASGHCYPSQRTELVSTTELSSYTDLMTAPAMKTTASSSGTSISEAEFAPLGTTKPMLSSTVETTVGLAHSMASAGEMWAMKAPSFGASTDDTPSISSSFDFTDLPKQQQVYHGLPFYDHHSGGQAIDSPFYLDSHDGKLARMPISDATDGMQWCQWPVCGPPDSWNHGMEPDEQTWPSPEYQTNYWPAQDALLNTAVDPYPLQTLPSSSIDHQSLRSTSTPTTNSPEPHLPDTLPIYPEPNSPYPHQQFHLQAHHHPSKPPTTQHQHQHQPQTPEQAQTPNQHPSTEIKASLHYIDTRDAFLVECKRRGLSYKDIKRIGGLKEAESTLRGRFRTLTKAKEQRVRKPKWLERDVSVFPSPSPAINLPPLHKARPRIKSIS